MNYFLSPSFLEISVTPTAHTPGPWHIENVYEIWTENAGGVLIAETSGQFIADIHSGADEWKANARLIAAAPDLLAALDYLLEQTLDQDVAFGIELTEKEQAAREMALAAMERATGNSPHSDDAK